MARAVGIDLGTTNSVVTVLEGGEPTVIANSEGSRTTPSVVAFAKNGEVLVGQSAKNQAVTNVDRTIRSVKREMGTTWKSAEIDGKKYTPQEISARVLQKLKRDAETYLGEPVTDAVITVPAYFEDAQRQATKEAGEIAGLNVLRIVNEPTAAALAYGLDKGETEQTILVFDLGGGTFDVSLLEIGDGVIEVKATAGDNHLGGDDWDEKVMTHLVKTFNASNGIDLSKDKLAMQRLREAAEKAKIELSGAQSTNINLPYITAGAEGPLHLDVTITRAEFQRMTQDLLDRTRAPFNQAIRDAGISVGRDRPRRPRRWLDPHAGRDRPGARDDRRQGAQQGRQPRRGRRHRCRAAGRCPPRRGQGRPAPRRHPAVPGHRDQGRDHDQAHRAQHHDPDQALRDLHDGRRQPAVRADPGLPGRARDGGLQQEARHVRADRSAAGAARRPADRGRLRHRRQRHRPRPAKDLGTGKEQSMTITGGSALPKDDIERMMKDAEAHADEDKKRREEAETRNLAESLQYQTEKFLAENGDKIPADKKEELGEALTELRSALGGSDIAAIKAAQEKVARVSQEVGGALYAQQAEAAAAEAPRR